MQASPLEPIADPIEDRNLTGIRPLIAPRSLRRQLPRSGAAEASVRGARAALRDCLHGRDPDRLVVIVGPCSIHDPDAALEYAERLGAVAERHADVLCVLMRTYFEKPRTTVGWKGLVNDPHLDGSRDVGEGLARARSLLLRLNELGVACASEVLDPFTPQYLADLLAWASIGARTAESQTHRELASGLSMPVGFKNATDGSLEPARNGVVAASHPHSFLGITADGAAAVVSTSGNPDCHLVLRGGSLGPNHDASSIAEAAALLEGAGLDAPPGRPVLVDCSHGNSGKDPTRQAGVVRAVLEQADARVLGLMLESNLETGRQDGRPGAALRRGVSITDACIGWAETEALLGEVAATLRARPLREETGNEGSLG
jgi:3-deoxy-7-phosphoheptulonate synthase